MVVLFFLCKQKTAYEMRISDWSSDVCSSALRRHRRCVAAAQRLPDVVGGPVVGLYARAVRRRHRPGVGRCGVGAPCDRRGRTGHVGKIGQLSPTGFRTKGAEASLPRPFSGLAGQSTPPSVTPTTLPTIAHLHATRSSMVRIAVPPIRPPAINAHT